MGSEGLPALAQRIVVMLWVATFVGFTFLLAEFIVKFTNVRPISSACLAALHYLADIPAPKLAAQAFGIHSFQRCIS